jgi:hypothetical protein
MPRRLLSAGVKVMEWSPLDVDHRAHADESKVRDAVAKCSRELDDMVTARGAGWTVEDGSFGFQMTDNGEALELRGWLVITRPGY